MCQRVLPPVLQQLVDHNQVHPKEPTGHSAREGEGGVWEVCQLWDSNCVGTWARLQGAEDGVGEDEWCRWYQSDLGHKR